MGLRLGALGMAGRNTATTSIVTRAMFEGLAAGLGRGVAGLCARQSQQMTLAWSRPVRSPATHE
jgi:hypothetical protein